MRLRIAACDRLRQPAPCWVAFLRPLAGSLVSMAKPNQRSSHRVATPPRRRHREIAGTVGRCWHLRIYPCPGYRGFRALHALRVLVAAVDRPRHYRRSATISARSARAPRLILQGRRSGRHCRQCCPRDQGRAAIYSVGWGGGGADADSPAYGCVNLVNFMDGIDWMTVAEVVPVTLGTAIAAALGALPVEGAVVAVALCGDAGLCAVQQTSRHDISRRRRQPADRPAAVLAAGTARRRRASGRRAVAAALLRRPTPRSHLFRRFRAGRTGDAGAPAATSISARSTAGFRPTLIIGAGRDPERLADRAGDDDHSVSRRLRPMRSRLSRHVAWSDFGSIASSAAPDRRLRSPALRPVHRGRRCNSGAAARSLRAGMACTDKHSAPARHCRGAGFSGVGPDQFGKGLAPATNP